MGNQSYFSRIAEFNEYRRANEARAIEIYLAYQDDPEGESALKEFLTIRLRLPLSESSIWLANIDYENGFEIL